MGAQNFRLNPEPQSSRNSNGEGKMNEIFTVCRGDARSPISRPFTTREQALDFVRKRIAEGIPSKELYLSVRGDGTINFTFFDDDELKA